MRFHHSSNNSIPQRFGRMLSAPTGRFSNSPRSALSGGTAARADSIRPYSPYIQNTYIYIKENL